MALISEYALTPDVFAEATHPDEQLAVLCFSMLRDTLMTEGVVRNLCSGSWRNVFAANDRQWHRRGKELLKKMVSQGRLRNYPQVLNILPESDAGWLEEALATNGQETLKGVVTTLENAELHRGNPLVASITELNRARWWMERGNTVRLNRTLDEFTKHLSLLFSCSNHLVFIDPYLDPSEPNYNDFIPILELAITLQPTIRIEIHRVITTGSGLNREVLSESSWESRFIEVLPDALNQKMNAEVFLWDDFHDRYLISNIAGISLPHGLDTSRQQQSITSWTRIDRAARDDVMREFDPASSWHKCQGSFVI